ncbi:MAG: hypothetical protein LCH81_19950 [Bacteroidetes bacterium]|nr:hypothetical protein [Bacteroidota bacterium]
MRLFLFLIPVFTLQTLYAQQKTVKTLDKSSFLREILGARYSKADKFWTLPNTQATLDTFGVDANGGLFAGVDTIAFREVDGHKEAWVLFTVEGYIFNFARLEKTPQGWSVRHIYYRLHEGAPGEYAPLEYSMISIGKKTFLSIKEDWYGMGIITTKWVLYEPFSAHQAAEIDIAKTGEKEQNPDQFREISFMQVRYEPVVEPLPDIMLTQIVEQKKKGSEPKLSTRTLRYRWDIRKAIFYKMGK